MSPRPEDSAADQAMTGESPGGQTPGSPGADFHDASSTSCA